MPSYASAYAKEVRAHSETKGKLHKALTERDTYLRMLRDLVPAEQIISWLYRDHGLEYSAVTKMTHADLYGGDRG